VLDPLNNLNAPCALTLFLDSMDTTAKRLTRVRSYPRRNSVVLRLAEVTDAGRG
jgi:hypothetical protein